MRSNLGQFIHDSQPASQPAIILRLSINRDEEKDQKLIIRRSNQLSVQTDNFEASRKVKSLWKGIYSKYSADALETGDEIKKESKSTRNILLRLPHNLTILCLT